MDASALHALHIALRGRRVAFGYQIRNKDLVGPEGHQTLFEVWWHPTKGTPKKVSVWPTWANAVDFIAGKIGKKVPTLKERWGDICDIE